MPYFADRTQDTTLTAGTGAITLDGTPPAGYQSFATAFGSGTRTVNYTIAGTSEWEVGIGTFNGTTGLTRDTVLSSSNSGALVNFSSSSKAVFVTAAAKIINSALIGNQLAQGSGWALP